MLTSGDGSRMTLLPFLADPDEPGAFAAAVCGNSLII